MTPVWKTLSVDEVSGCRIETLGPPASKNLEVGASSNSQSSAYLRETHMLEMLRRLQERRVKADPWQ
ncbi:hypothetical protein KC347_g294 [Hortaea werneckii]|nr:hypothetical protein KC347_g294 [Hortaea werneckii]